MIESEGRQANWRRANPLKYRAHLMVEAAQRRGELVKQPCEVCGATEADGVRIDAHHDSYEPGRELDVRWLCRRHHTRLHAGGEDMFTMEMRNG